MEGIELYGLDNKVDPFSNKFKKNYIYNDTLKELITLQLGVPLPLTMMVRN